MATSVKLSPLKLSAAFRSNVPLGKGFPPESPTGPDLGPGSFPGAESVTKGIEIKDPYKKTSVFMDRTPKLLKAKRAYPDSNGELIPFSEMYNSGFHFNLTGAKGAKNSHLTEWTQQKISKIYPRFKKIGGSHSIDELHES